MPTGHRVWMDNSFNVGPGKIVSSGVRSSRIIQRIGMFQTPTPTAQAKGSRGAFGANPSLPSTQTGTHRRQVRLDAVDVTIRATAIATAIRWQEQRVGNET